MDSIQLDETLFKGNGRHKRCYVVPDDKTKCVKISYNDGGIVDLEREIKYLGLIKNTGKDYSMLPKYYGPVDTNLGKGYMYEYITDYDGSDCKTLENYLEDEDLLADNYDMLLDGLKKFRNDLLENEIITMGIFSENIIVQQIGANPDQFKFRMINDMGSAALIPLEYYISFFAKQRILKRWDRFIGHIVKSFKGSQIDRLVQDLRQL